ncbi:hypothetical protein [Salinisphaera sp. G21_0]|uniref:hypothetical protein n=1 Tax=Salinisphaera sp. G21_0 TaxID=2821094 RepID=UPI001ADCE0FB|nr:hypothetical protein [Salinisphaera sp. G21_0]MBO9482421.1 hypothetical protein [Salinisphaera sp. G21_0]
MGAGAPELPPEFSEIFGLTEKRARHRADIQSLVDAAEYSGTRYLWAVDGNGKKWRVGPLLPKCQILPISANIQA